MKKIKMLIMALIMALTCFGVTTPVRAYADGGETSPASTYVTTNGLGYTINVATATNPLNINLGAPVLDETYLNSLAFVRLTREETISQTYKSIDYANISDNISNIYNSSISTSLEYDIFKAAIKNDFYNTLNITYSEYESRYFAMYYYERLIYEEAIPSYTSFAFTYADCYSDAFLYNLSNLVGEDITAEDYYNFFNTFGTHLVASVKMGGRLQSNYAVASNALAFTDNVQTLLSNSIDVAVSNYAQVGASTALTLNTSNTTLNTGSMYDTRIKVTGGNPQYITSLQNEIGGDFSNWQTTLSADNATTIGYSQGGLLPLWDILPEEYSSISTTMETHFNEYIENISVQEGDPFKFTGANSCYVFNTLTCLGNGVVRGSTEYTITHDGIVANPYDTVNLRDIFGVYVGTMKNDGVKTIRLHFSINIKEKNDGYQHIYLYTNPSGAVLLWNIKQEHTSGKVNKNYATYTYTIDVPVEKLIETNGFAVRYNASGTYDDTWINSNLVIKYTLLT